MSLFVDGAIILWPDGLTRAGLRSEEVVPRILNCGHTFCESCLIKMLRCETTRACRFVYMIRVCCM